MAESKGLRPNKKKEKERRRKNSTTKKQNNKMQDVGEKNKELSLTSSFPLYYLYAIPTLTQIRETSLESIRSLVSVLPMQGGGHGGGGPVPPPLQDGPLQHVARHPRRKQQQQEGIRWILKEQTKTIRYLV